MALVIRGVVVLALLAFAADLYHPGFLDTISSIAAQLLVQYALIACLAAVGAGLSILFLKGDKKWAGFLLTGAVCVFVALKFSDSFVLGSQTTFPTITSNGRCVPTGVLPYTFGTTPGATINAGGVCSIRFWHNGHSIYLQQSGSTRRLGPFNGGNNYPPFVEKVWSADGAPFEGHYQLYVAN
ncbi:MAG: hypothetical protein QG621_240 [Patescibacteria group bacterium]|nr:hypothetical protein [Patescibacteria group bacterium]